MISKGIPFAESERKVVYFKSQMLRLSELELERSDLPLVYLMELGFREMEGSIQGPS